MKTLMITLVLLIAPATAFAYCEYPMLTGNFQYDQTQQQAYQNCINQERFNQETKRQLEQMRQEQERQRNRQQCIQSGLAGC